MTILTTLQRPYSDAGALMIKLFDVDTELQYTVHKRETDIAFATRLTESQGISCHFAHGR
ncbi:contractile injection system protein, VgrG/Pvc8 family [Pseudooceanicola spongiae]|uniref:Uncharacterized protein n=1 Tax=Pseudooceanicola spongiae TaxID=2613965 RepID=A0A7L9WU79_9RHOB|nr:hypothetical protein F3W81_17825 [Pseudooceanicola spongiae]